MKYIGMDAHSSTCVMSVINQEGVEVDFTEIATNGRLLVDYLKRQEGKKKLVFEESELSFWLYETLRHDVDELIVCNPVHNKQFKRAKTDKLDARHLAQLLRGNFLHPVYHDGSDREQFRSFMSAYEDLVQDGVRLKNRYKSLFRRRGLKAKGEKIYQDESLLKELAHKDDNFVGQKKHERLKLIEEQREKYVEKMYHYQKRFPEIKRLMKLPGIGCIQACKIVAQVVEAKRFKDKYKYYAYCGLVRHPRISGGQKYGMEKIHGNQVLKCVYRMAAHTIKQGESGFKKYYEQKIAAGHGEKQASNAVSRKLAAVSLSMLKHGTSYDEERMLTEHF